MTVAGSAARHKKRTLEKQPLLGCASSLIMRRLVQHSLGGPARGKRPRSAPAGREHVCFGSTSPALDEMPPNRVDSRFAQTFGQAVGIWEANAPSRPSRVLYQPASFSETTLATASGGGGSGNGPLPLPRCRARHTHALHRAHTLCACRVRPSPTEDGREQRRRRAAGGPPGAWCHPSSHLAPLLAVPVAPFPSRKKGARGVGTESSHQAARANR
jgi:hypothetical protein